MSLITINSEKETLKAEIQRLKRNFRSERDSTWRQFDRMPYAHHRMHGEGVTEMLSDKLATVESRIAELEKLYYNPMNHGA
jgi:hypothetical protein